MVVVVVVSLISTRFIIQELGITDYGIFSIVSGVVLFSSFISNSLMSSIQRFFAFDLGKYNHKKLQID